MWYRKKILSLNLLDGPGANAFEDEEKTVRLLFLSFLYIYFDFFCWHKMVHILEFRGQLKPALIRFFYEILVFLNRWIAKVYCIAHTASSTFTRHYLDAHFFFVMHFSLRQFHFIRICMYGHWALGMCTNKLVIHLLVINSMELFFGFGQM